MRRKSSGEVVNPAWLQFSFPTRWHYDVLRALDYFRSTREAPDSRIDEAIDLLRSKRQADGTWLLERLEMPAGVGVSGLESDGGDQFFCGGGRTGKVRAVRRPSSKRR